MIKRHRTHRGHYLINMILFIGFAFDFFIRNDHFLGAVLIFNGIINLLAYQQVPRKVAPITVILNLFNCIISATVSYNYGGLDYSTLFIVWLVFTGIYLVAASRQIYSLMRSKHSKIKQKRKIS